MLTKRDRTAAYKIIEKVQRRRYANVRLLLDRAGGVTELALMADISVGLLNNIGGPNPTRSIGEYLARKLELALGLSPGWLDEEHK